MSEADFYDELETRSADERTVAQTQALREQIANAKANAAYWKETLDGVDAGEITLGGLKDLPVTRKSDLMARQAEAPPYGGLAASAPEDLARLFLSPGPIADPEGFGRDWWRFARAFYAAGFRKGDRVINCFSYHLTPAGHMFESAAHALGIPVLPGGVGNTEGQVQAADFYKINAYSGTPDFVKILLEKADALGTPLGLEKAMVAAGPLFPSMREEYEARGVHTRQCYGTADLGMVAYESQAMEGMICDEHVVVEIVTPGTGDPVEEGAVGEVLVTLLANRDYPLIRFATGDLSAILAGASPCGRTAPRIKGWMGRADQTTKIRGMFVRPEQVAAFAKRHPEIAKTRVVVTSDKNKHDVMTVKVETAQDLDPATLAETAQSVFKLKATIEPCAPGSLPDDGKVIEDARDFES
ncbi:MAG: phenylacetate--CoA ligase family protein [Marivibrio sp.]|uniref:phenylacetate--CoA ligase family protein n=1 Tax=Marivibrio sp. TaxID=2039719 RepID=UPI0032EC685E